jgi:hypothetical protein
MSKRIRIACGTGALMLASVAPAQEIKIKSAPEADVLHATSHAVAGPTFEFISSEMGVPGKVVKGAPYSADAVTETTQKLADGNRISRKSSTALYRDAEGRTRRELTLNGIGPWASASDVPEKIVFINDPVVGVSYSLNEKDKTARKMDGNAMFFSFASSARGTVPAAGETRTFERQIRTEQIRSEKIVSAGAGAAVGATGAVAGVRVPGPGLKDAKTESLGKRNIEGTEAEGTRMTWTIPAGQIGNDLPIEIVSERWYSPELQTMVMTRQLDPRMGETIYKLTNLRRGNPSPQMFEVPSDYKIITEEIPKKIMKLRTDEK